MIAPTNQQFRWRITHGFGVGYAVSVELEPGTGVVAVAEGVVVNIIVVELLRERHQCKHI